MAIAHFDSKSFDEAIASGTTLVDFWATWCGPCRMQAPILDAFESEMGTVVKVGKVDVDEQPDIAARYNVFSIPTLISASGSRTRISLAACAARSGASA